MEVYTVFYSFQTDSNEKTNFHFLRDVLKEACKSIKQYNVKLDYGFTESTGTRPLTEHMLGQAEKADIFIADVTYTSEFQMFLVNKKVWGYNLRMAGRENRIKKYPNGNVLLETGYSWAKKGYSRTLLVINTAYGDPKSTSLPADMMHLEHPMPYHLSEIQLSDEVYINDLKSKLKSALRNKILDMISIERGYLRTSFDPISHFEDWPKPNNQIPYRFTSSLRTKFQNYRDNLEKPGQTVKLIGPKKSGKTRLAYELFKRNKPHFSVHDCIFKTYYYNFLFGSFEKIHESLLRMIRKKQHFVLILDNCNSTHIANVEAILDGSNISILFIQEN
jgi:hypothetical protein